MVPQTLLRFKRGASQLTTDAYGAWGEVPLIQGTALALNNPATVPVFGLLGIAEMM
jgi:hypothetical protein